MRTVRRKPAFAQRRIFCRFDKAAHLGAAFDARCHNSHRALIEDARDEVIFRTDDPHKRTHIREATYLKDTQRGFKIVRTAFHVEHKKVKAALPEQLSDGRSPHLLYHRAENDFSAFEARFDEISMHLFSRAIMKIGDS